MGHVVDLLWNLKDKSRLRERMNISYSEYMEFVIQRRQNRPKMRIMKSFRFVLELKINRRILRKMEIGHITMFFKWEKCQDFCTFLPPKRIFLGMRLEKEWWTDLIQHGRPSGQGWQQLFRQGVVWCYVWPHLRQLRTPSVLWLSLSSLPALWGQALRSACCVCVT